MSREGPIDVLNECIDLMKKKASDYNNPNSSVRQAMYYPDGVKTITDILWAKILRLRSLCESEDIPKNESLRDTFLDIVNYASFGAAWIDGRIEGQGDVDAFNVPHAVTPKSSDVFNVNSTWEQTEYFIAPRPIRTTGHVSNNATRPADHVDVSNFYDPSPNFSYYPANPGPARPVHYKDNEQPEVEWPEPEAAFDKHDAYYNLLAAIRSGKI